MKKSLKKLALNKTAVSDLTDQVKGGRPGSVIIIKTSTDPTAMTWCYICPVEEVQY